MARASKPKGTAERLTTQQFVNAVVKVTCDIMRRSSCADLWCIVSLPAGAFVNRGRA